MRISDWSSDVCSSDLNSTRSDDGYRDLASLEGAPVARGSDQAYVGLSGLGGQWGLGWYRRLDRAGSRNGFASLGWSRQSAHAAYFSVQVTRRIGAGQGNAPGLDATLPWTLPLGRHDSAAGRAARSREGHSPS